MQLRAVIIGACFSSAIVVAGAAAGSVRAAHQSDIRSVTTLLNAVAQNKLDAFNLIYVGASERNYRTSRGYNTYRNKVDDAADRPHYVVKGGIAPMNADGWRYTRELLRRRSGLGETGLMYLVDQHYIVDRSYFVDVGWDQCYNLTATQGAAIYTDLLCTPAMVRAYYEGLHAENWIERFIDHRGIEVFSLAIRVTTAYGESALLVLSIDVKEAMTHMREETRGALAVASLLIILIAFFGMVTCKVIGRSIRAAKAAEERAAQVETQSLMLIKEMTDARSEQLELLRA